MSTVQEKKSKVTKSKSSSTKKHKTIDLYINSREKMASTWQQKEAATIKLHTDQKIEPWNSICSTKSNANGMKIHTNLVKYSNKAPTIATRSNSEELINYQCIRSRFSCCHFLYIYFVVFVIFQFVVSFIFILEHVRLILPLSSVRCKLYMRL